MKKLFISFCAVALVVVVAFTAAASYFTDVDNEDLYYKSIGYLSDEGIIVGYEDGSFGYGLNINRAEFMKIVVEAKYFGENLMFLNSYTDEACFDDVPADEWYTGYICYGIDQGWVEGYGDGNFKPAQDINFVEGIKIILEVFDVDYEVSDPWYKGLVQAAADENIIPLTISEFAQDIERREMVDMIVRKIKYDEGTQEEFLETVFEENVVTYETLEQGYDMSEVLIGCGGQDWASCCYYNGVTYADGDSIVQNECTTCMCVEGEVKYCTGLCVPDDDDVTDEIAEEGLLDTLCDFTYNIVEEPFYRGFSCADQDYDLADHDGFQALFPDGSYYITGDGGIVYDGSVYFTTLITGGDVAVTNRLYKYDSGTDEVTQLWEYEDLEGYGYIMLGIDKENELAVLYEDGAPLDLSGDPWACWMPHYPWAYMDLYAVNLAGGLLEDYNAPSWKLVEAEDEYNACMAE
jgi:hypothetical protein